MGLRAVDPLQIHGQGTFGIFALMRFLLLSVAFMSYKAGVDALVMTRYDRNYPVDEHVTVNEGETLVMNCYASRTNLESVWWGKVITDTNTDWLTGNSYVDTDDSRVSVDSSTIWYRGRYYNAYSIHITDVTTSDSGKYRCSVTWEDHSLYGFLLVTVNYFPQQDPLCSTNEADVSSVNNIDVRCDTADGTPQVNITWTVQETGEEVSSTIHDHNLGGQARRLSQLRFRQELRNHILVCTVTSSAFPGQNKTCYVGPIVGATSTTEQLETAHTAATTNAEILTTKVQAEITSQLFPDDHTGLGITTFDDSGGPDDRPTSSSPNVGTVSAAVAVPSVTLLLIVVLLCILKRKRRRKDGNGGGEPVRPTAAGVWSNHETRRDSGTAEEQDSACKGSYRPGEETYISPYEVELDPACGSVSYAEVAETNSPARSSGVRYETVHRDDSTSDSAAQESHAEENLYEHVTSSSGDVVTGGDNDYDKAEVRSENGESEGMVDNPIYQSYDD